MKTLTVQQPYASLIASGEKWIENRTWYTNYRGPLAIHAAKSSKYIKSKLLASYPTGRIVAITNLVACVEYEEILMRGNSIGERFLLIPNTLTTWKFAMSHYYMEGPWCWILHKTEPLAVEDMEPINGKQGLWNWNCKRSIRKETR